MSYSRREVNIKACCLSSVKYGKLSDLRVYRKIRIEVMKTVMNYWDKGYVELKGHVHCPKHFG